MPDGRFMRHHYGPSGYVPEEPPCWHKRINSVGLCVDCGVRAAIQLHDQSDPAEAERKALEAMNPFQRQLRIGSSTQAELAGNPEPDHQPVSAEEFENDMRTVQRANALEELLAAASEAASWLVLPDTHHARERLLAAIAKYRGLK